MIRLAHATVLFAVLAPATALAQPMQGDPHAGVEGAPQRERTIATAEPSLDVPIGEIRITVVDAAGRPVAGASTNIGTMGPEGRRDRVTRQTGADGVARYEQLATGTSQAYRVNVPYQGATYSSNPFQLPTDRGYAVRILRLPVTRELRTLVTAGQVMIELRDARLHISQQLQLLNLGAETIAFPTDGAPITLPRGFLAFQTDPQMTDQRVAEDPGHSGLRLTGSLPPGSAVLSWSYDVPREGSEHALTLPMPFRTFAYRVTVEAPPGLEVEVSDLPRTEPSFPPPERTQLPDGRPALSTTLERTPEDPPITAVRFHVTGIPGPGPLRWFAVAFAFLFAIGGVIFGVAPGAGANVAGERARRRKQLEAESKTLDAELARGAIGPNFHAQRREAIVSELAQILHDEAREKPAAAARPKAVKAKAAKVSGPRSER